MSDPTQPPSYPAWSSPAPAAAAPVVRPKQVDSAFWLYIAAAVLSVVALILSLVTIGAAKKQSLTHTGLDAEKQRRLDALKKPVPFKSKIEQTKIGRQS